MDKQDSPEKDIFDRNISLKTILITAVIGFIAFTGETIIDNHIKINEERRKARQNALEDFIEKSYKYTSEAYDAFCLGERVKNIEDIYDNYQISFYKLKIYFSKIPKFRFSIVEKEIKEFYSDNKNNINRTIPLNTARNTPCEEKRERIKTLHTKLINYATRSIE